MGDTTDELLDLAKQVSPLPPGRELDMLLTAGERISMALLAMAIANLGPRGAARSPARRPASSPTPRTARRASSTSPQGASARRSDKGYIAIVAGFQGVSMDTKDITTLGRGGSDTTAVALAAALEADVCEIYTDVDGVFTADPRIVPTARKIHRLSNEEMLEMAASGAKILHLRCVEYARRFGMPIHVRSSFSRTRAPGSPSSRGPMPSTPRNTATPTGSSRRRDRGSPDHRRRRARPQRGQDHRRRGARPGGQGGDDLPGRRRGRASTST